MLRRNSHEVLGFESDCYCYILRTAMRRLRCQPSEQSSFSFVHARLIHRHRICMKLELKDNPMQLRCEAA